MNDTKIFRTAFFFILSLFATLSVSGQTQTSAVRKVVERYPAQLNEIPGMRLVPQEDYGEEVLDLLERKKQDGIWILQFNFFTDNIENTYPKRIANRLVDIRKQFPLAPITIALESKKDLDDPKGKGAAQRNSKTKMLFMGSGIDVHDVFGQSIDQQNPKGREDGVSHTKLVMAGDEIIAGSSNLTKQSTDVGANNEMNVFVRSQKIAKVLREYVAKIISSPGQMIDLEVEDGEVRMLTDRLHFNELISQIRSAQKGDQIGLSMYQFLYRNENDQQAKEVLTELISAHRRGVKLEIYFNRAEDLAIQNTVANLKVAELLLNEGISRVYFDPESKISHSKFLYRISANEKVAIISSVNIYRGDFNDNHQLTWIIKSNTLTDQLDSYFKHQIAYDGVLVNRIPKDPITELRYKVSSVNPEKTVWNSTTPPTRMLRVWRGYKQANVSQSEFERNIDTRLIPETIEVGGGRGLNAYLPSFFAEGKANFLPDEVAIVDYVDEEKYNAIRTTERGKKYGPLHFEEGLFSKQNVYGYNSGSLVAINYSGTVEIQPSGRAYILGNDVNWQDGVTLRRTIIPIQNMTASDVQQYLSRFLERFDTLSINGLVAIVDPQYLMLMINAIDQKSAQLLDSSLDALEVGRFKKIDQIVFKNQTYGVTHLESGLGINVKFESLVKPREELMYTILNSLGKSKMNAQGSCEHMFNK